MKYIIPKWNCVVEKHLKHEILISMHCNILSKNKSKPKQTPPDPGVKMTTIYQTWAYLKKNINTSVLVSSIPRTIKRKVSPQILLLVLSLFCYEGTSIFTALSVLLGYNEKKMKLTICTASLFPLKPSSTADTSSLQQQQQGSVCQKIAASFLFAIRMDFYRSTPGPIELRQWLGGRQKHQSKFILKYHYYKDCTRHCLIQKKL